MNRRHVIAMAAWLVLGVMVSPLTAAEVGQWERFEGTVTNDRRYDRPLRDVTLNTVFTRPDGTQLRHIGFWDGGTTWKFRVMPDQVGQWRYEATFSDGRPGTSGTFTCVASDVPGMIAHYEANPIWFGYKGGDAVLLRSFHVGDRFFAENWPAEQREAFLDWAQDQGYNMLSIASHLLNRRQRSRGDGWQTPDLWDHRARTVRPAEFAKMEAILDDLARRGIIVFPFAGFRGQGSNFPRRSEHTELFIRYTIARLGAYWNITFSVGGPEFGSRGAIDRLGNLIHSANPYGHLISTHDVPDFADSDWKGFEVFQGAKSPNLASVYRRLMDRHDGRKPVYAQETLWPGNRLNRPITPDQVRRKAMVMLFAATTINFGDMDGNSSSGFGGSMDLEDRRQEYHDAIRTSWDVFATLPWQRTRPAPQAVDNGYCLAHEGHDYLVYLPDGGEVSVKVAPGSYRVEWISAAEPGQRQAGGTTDNGRNLAAPDGGEWILHLAAVEGSDGTDGDGGQ